MPRRGESPRANGQDVAWSDTGAEKTVARVRRRRRRPPSQQGEFYGPRSFSNSKNILSISCFQSKRNDRESRGIFDPAFLDRLQQTRVWLPDGPLVRLKPAQRPSQA